MGWATKYIDGLKAGQTVKFRPHGSSMDPKVKSGQLVTVEPITDETVLSKNDIVLCKVGSAQYLHLIWDVCGDQYRIGNNKNHENGRIPRSQIYGKCVRVED